MDIHFDLIYRITVIATDAVGPAERWISVDMFGGEEKTFYTPKEINNFIAELRRYLPDIADKLQAELTEKRLFANYECVIYYDPGPAESSTSL